MFRETRLETAAYRSLKNWVPTHPQEILDVEAEGNTVDVYLTGNHAPEAHDALAKLISEKAGYPVKLHVTWFQKLDLVASADEVEHQASELETDEHAAEELVGITLVVCHRAVRRVV